MESSVNRSTILTMLEAQTPPEYVTGYWKAYSITLPDGIELATKRGVKMAGRGLPVHVYNKDGQYRAVLLNSDGSEGRDVELSYVINEAAQRISGFVLFD